MKKILLLVTLLFALSSFIYTQDSVSGALKGTVIEKQTRKPFPNAKVMITNKDTGVLINTTTDSIGQFIRNNLMPGMYEITISAEGYQTVKMKQTVFATERIVLLPPPELSKKRKKSKTNKNDKTD